MKDFDKGSNPVLTLSPTLSFCRGKVKYWSSNPSKQGVLGHLGCKMIISRSYISIAARTKNGGDGGKC